MDARRARPGARRSSARVRSTIGVALASRQCADRHDLARRPLREQRRRRRAREIDQHVEVAGGQRFRRRSVRRHGELGHRRRDRASPRRSRRADAAPDRRDGDLERVARQRRERRERCPRPIVERAPPAAARGCACAGRCCEPASRAAYERGECAGAQRRVSRAERATRDRVDPQRRPRLSGAARRGRPGRSRGRAPPRPAPAHHRRLGRRPDRGFERRAQAAAAKRAAASAGDRTSEARYSRTSLGVGVTVEHQRERPRDRRAPRATAALRSSNAATPRRSSRRHRSEAGARCAATAAARAFCGASCSAASAAACASAASPAASDASASARFGARWPALFAAASRHAAIASGYPAELPEHLAQVERRVGRARIHPLRVAKAEHGVDRAAFALMAAAALEPLPVPGRRHHERRRFIASRTVAGVSRDRARPGERAAKALQHARAGDRAQPVCGGGHASAPAARAATTARSPAHRGRARRKTATRPRRAAPAHERVVAGERSLRHVGRPSAAATHGHGAQPSASASPLPVATSSAIRASIASSVRHSASVHSHPRAGRRHALGQRTERRHDDRASGGPCLRQRQAEGLGSGRRIRDKLHAIVVEQVREVVRIVMPVDRQHRVVALPRAVPDVEVADQHEAYTRSALVRTSATMRSSRRAPLSGPIAPSTATVGTSSSGRSNAARDARSSPAPRRAGRRRRAVRDHLGRALREIAREHRRRPLRRGDEKCALREQVAMARPPRRDVDAGEPGPGAEAARAGRGVGHRAAIHAVGPEERDRRAREIEVVHRVAVGKIEAREGFDHPVATAGNVVQVDEVDAERRGDAAEKCRPRFVGQPPEIEGAARRRRRALPRCCQSSPTAIAT